jgi:hypothetical protein
MGTFCHEILRATWTDNSESKERIGSCAKSDIRPRSSVQGVVPGTWFRSMSYPSLPSLGKLTTTIWYHPN